MRTILVILTATILTSLYSPAYAFDMGKLKESASNAVDDGVMVTGDAKKLVESLTGDLGVSPKQAAGGTAAMLALAKNQLPADQFSGITDKVPGISDLLGGGEGGGLAASALSQVSNMDSVLKAFSSLGLSPDMVAQFAPTILKFLGNEGVGTNILGSLQGLWGAAG